MEYLFQKEIDRFDVLKNYLLFNSNNRQYLKTLDNKLIYVDNNQTESFQDEKINIVLKKSTLEKFKTVMNKIKRDSFSGIIPNNSFFHYSNIKIVSNYKLISQSIFSHVHNTTIDFEEFLNGKELNNIDEFFTYLLRFSKENNTAICFSDLIDSDAISYTNYGLSFVVNPHITNKQYIEDNCFGYYYNLLLRNGFLLNEKNLNIVIDCKPEYTEDTVKLVDNDELLMLYKILYALYNKYLLNNNKEEYKTEISKEKTQKLYIDFKCFYKKIKDTQIIKKIMIDYIACDNSNINFLNLFEKVSIKQESLKLIFNR